MLPVAVRADGSLGFIKRIVSAACEDAIGPREQIERELLASQRAVETSAFGDDGGLIRLAGRAFDPGFQSEVSVTRKIYCSPTDITDVNVHATKTCGGVRIDY